MIGASSAGLHVAQTAVKRLARRAVAARVPYALLRSVSARRPHVAILMYHTLGADDDDLDAWTVVRVSDFTRQIAFLRRYYDVVGLDQALASPAGDRPTAVITFDDGDVGLHRHLLPLVEELQLPVTVYVATGQIETGRPHWFDALMNALQTRAPVRVDLSSLGIGTLCLGTERGEANWLLIASLLDRLKIETPARRAAACERILAQTKTLERRAHADLGPMTIDQLRQLARHRLVTIGSHTHCHSLLDRIPLAEATASIERSCRLLEQWTGVRPQHFAYPNGNHSPALEQAVAAMGFKSATITTGGLWRGNPNLMALQRLPVGRFDDLGRFALRLAGL